MNTLVLSSNWIPVDNVARLISRMPALESISLDSTGIVTLPHTIFTGNSRLKSVNVSGNFLISMEIDVFSHLGLLEVLDLSHNYFMGLPQEFFDIVRQKPRLKMVYLQVWKLFLYG